MRRSTMSCKFSPFDLLPKTYYACNKPTMKAYFPGGVRCWWSAKVQILLNVDLLPALSSCPKAHGARNLAQLFAKPV